MGMTKKILNWVDRKYDEVCDNPDEKHPYAKAFVLGAVEGAIDGAVFAYPILLASCIVAGSQIKKLKG